MPTKCDACGREEYMPFVCKLCAGKFCVEHRIPENHACAGLADYRTRAGPRLYRAPHEESPRPAGRPSVHLSTGARFQRLLTRLEGRATPVLLGVMLAVLVLELVVRAVWGDAAFRAVFVLDTDFYARPWAILTSVFAHAGFYHFFGNALVLFFFGATLEQLLGTRRFLSLFFVAGIAAGLAEVVVFGYLLGDVFGTEHGVLGASGAIMGVLGTLTVLAPRLTVLVFFVIPAPLWAITLVYALLDIFALGGGGNVANLAHLTGLAIGLAWGKHLRDQGLRVRVERPAWRRV